MKTFTAAFLLSLAVKVSSMSTGKASPGSEADLPEDPCKPDLSCPHQGRHELTGECCCCQRKTVGEVSYIKVEYLGRTVPENCLNDCVYEMEGEEGGSRFCFAHGSLPVVCKDDQEAPEPVSMPVASPTPNSNPSDDEDLVVFTKPLPPFYKIETENWEEYKEIINISFDDPAEEEIKKIIFNRNIGSIKSNNELSENKQFITKFSHLTYNELIKLHTGDDNDKEIIEKRKPGTTKKRQLVLPKSFDWRAIAGAVRPVKNQGLCGSCWAFATTAAIETRHFLDTGSSVDLSEQQILDCTYPQRDGCGGGWYLNAYRRNLKQTTLKSYPYTGKGNEACKIPPSIEYVSSISGFNNNIKGEVAMKEALLSQGSLSVRMHVQETPSFAHYDFKKVYQYNGCDIRPNHVVVITGYGEDEDGTKFWIVKNSWGTNWALQGYFRILRGANMCGIEDWPAYPETPNPTGCVESPGVYICRGDNVPGGVFPAKSRQECAKACWENPLCRFWTLRTTDNYCWLKLSDKCKGGPNDNWITGTKACGSTENILDTEMPPEANAEGESCRIVASGPFGGSASKEVLFNDRIVASNGKITQIAFRNGSWMDQIQATYGNIESLPHGGAGGEPAGPYVLQGSDIVKVEGIVFTGTSQPYIQSLTFIDQSQRRHGPFGRTDSSPGRKFTSAPNNCFLRYLSGSTTGSDTQAPSGNFVNQLTFNWCCK